MNILDEAKEIIYGDREKTYGHPSVNLDNTAKFWSVYLKKDVNAQDVATMMVLLKVSRLMNNPDHYDSLLDGLAYFALVDRIKNNN